MQREMLRRGYSQRTIITYILCIKNFMDYCRKDINKTTKLDIKSYIDNHLDKENSGNTINVHLNAIKFLFEEMLNRRLTLKIKAQTIPQPFYTKSNLIFLDEKI